MRELLAERAPRRLVAAAAIVTLVAAGATLRQRGPDHHTALDSARCGELKPLVPQTVAVSRGSETVDLDGDGVPEVVTMTFTQDGNELVTRVGVERVRGSELVAIPGDDMTLRASLDPAPCIGRAIAWPATSPGGGRIELTDYVRTDGAVAQPTCERGETREFRLRGGILMETPRFRTIYW